MARARLGLGDFGKITTIEQAPKVFVAKCRFRGKDGKTRQAEATSTTKAKAEKALKDRVKARVGDRDSELGGDTRIKVLAAKWWQTIEDRCAAGDLNPDTRREYLRYRDKVIEACGDLAIRECSMDGLSNAIRDAAGDHRRTASEMKRTLVGMFDYAVKARAAEYNVAKDIELGRGKAAAPRALTSDELADMRARIHQYENSGGADAPRATGKGRGGRPRSKYLADVFEVQLSIWGRIGEVLALQWDADIQGIEDDAGSPIIVDISSTLKHRSKAESERLGKPMGLYRQEDTKTDAGNRVWRVTGHAADVLRRLYRDRAEGVPWVFATSVGTPLNPSNVRTALRKARGEEYSWVTPHTLRRTGITHGLLITKDLAAVSKAAGHTRFQTTEGYADKRHFGFDFSNVMETLSPRSEQQNELVG